MLNFIITDHKNTGLLTTIKHILQVFPEAVVVRKSIDGREEVRGVNEADSSTVFINDTAKLDIEGNLFGFSRDQLIS